MTLAKRGTTKGKDVVRRFWEEVFNSGDAGAVGDFISDDFALEDLSTGWKLDRRNVVDLIDGLQANVRKPEVRVIDQFLTDRDFVVSRLVFRALPPEGNGKDEFVELNAISIDQIIDDHVVDTKLMWDAWTANSELGDDGLTDWRFPWW